MGDLLPVYIHVERMNSRIKISKPVFCRDQEHAEIYRLFPKAQIEHIQNAGHWVHSDQPLKFVNTVVEFLNKE